MKLNRSKLRKIILNEIKRLNEGTGYHHSMGKRYQDEYGHYASPMRSEQSKYSKDPSVDLKEAFEKYISALNAGNIRGKEEMWFAENFLGYAPGDFAGYSSGRDLALEVRDYGQKTGQGALIDLAQERNAANRGYHGGR